MKILIDIGHPAHVHLFKHIARQLQADGHQVWWVCRQMPIIQRLLEAEGFPYTVVGRKHTTLIGKALSVLHQTVWTIRFARRQQIDIGLSSGIVQALASRCSGMKAVIMDDDDDCVEPWISRIGHPLCHTVLTPSAIHRRSSHARYYNGTHELAYLHPNRFQPDSSRLQPYGLQPGDRYFVVRFVAFHGHHDIHETGLTVAQKEQLVRWLSLHGRVVISSEAPLSSIFESYRLPVPPEEMHHLLGGATLLVGDSQTMCSEAGLLGVPALKCNTFAGRLSVPNLMEQRYRLCYSYTPDQFDALMQQLEQLLNNPHLHEEWRLKQRRMLEETVDVTDFVTDYLEQLA